MQNFIQLFLACAAVFIMLIALGLLADHSAYKRDMRVCMLEGSRADCEAKLK